jgi:copper(I)-binding protein
MNMTQGLRSLLLGMGLCVTGQALGADMMAVDAWSRAMPPTARVLPVYLTLHNHSAKDISLVSISSEYGQVELHQTIMENDMMKMLSVDSIIVASNKQVKLAPMGLHAMITGLTQSVPKEGDTLALTLNFDNGEKINIDAKVHTPKMTEHASGEHQHH